MAANIPQLIFEQFLEIVEQFAINTCCQFDECDFDYRVREQVGHRLLDVLYVIEDKCCRKRNVIVTIDFTNICIEDLVTCKWVCYLEKKAREYVNDICPPKIAIIKDEPRKCRPQPPKWTPFPCGIVSTVIRKKRPVPKPSIPEVIIENECECVPICEYEPCVPKQQVILRYENDLPKHKCGDVSILVNNPEKKAHDFDQYKGNPDYNNHIWNNCCSNKKPACCGN